MHNTLLISRSQSQQHIITMPAEVLLKPSSAPCQVARDPVRSKFLMRIGVVGSANHPITSKHLSLADASSETADSCTTTSSIIPTRDLQNVPRYEEQLKYNRRDERKHIERRMHLRLARSANPQSSSPTTPLEETSKSKRCISFNESVKVVPIPMRNEYSDRIKTRLWSKTIEIYENAGE